MIVTQYPSDTEEGEIVEPRSESKQQQQNSSPPEALVLGGAVDVLGSLSATKRKKLKKVLKAAAAAAGAGAASKGAQVPAGSAAGALPYYNIYGDNVSWLVVCHHP
jgi:hypothetical protein